MNNQQGKVTFGRPADKSLQAFKDWINGMCDALSIPRDDPKNPTTDEEWERDWKAFWADKQDKSR